MAAPDISTPVTIFYEIAFVAVLIACCGIISLQTCKLYRLSKYKGLKYFSYAFLFGALAFAMRIVYIILTVLFQIPEEVFSNWIRFAVAYFATLAALYILYSLIWKKHEPYKLCCLTQRKHIRLHVVAIVIAGIQAFALPKTEADVWYFFIICQMIILGYALKVSWIKRTLASKKGKSGWIDFYPAILLLLLIMYLLFLFEEILTPIFPTIYAYLFGVVALLFLVMVYHVLKVTKWKLV